VIGNIGASGPRTRKVGDVLRARLVADGLFGQLADAARRREVVDVHVERLALSQALARGFVFYFVKKSTICCVLSGSSPCG